MNLEEYLVYYYQTFRCSKEKLKKKAKEKFGDDFSIEKYEKTLKDIDFLIDEKKDIKNIIAGYKYKRKSIFYISQKLFERMYDKNMISECMKEIDEEYQKEILTNEFKRFSKEELEKNKKKIIESFLRKGFFYGDISNAFKIALG